MVIKDLSCPVCSADLPVSGDEQRGDDVYCTYCGAPCKLTASPRSEDCNVEEDF